MPQRVVNSGDFPSLAFFLLLCLPAVNEITSCTYTGVKLQPAVGASSIKSVLQLLNSEDQIGYSHLFFISTDRYKAVPVCLFFSSSLLSLQEAPGILPSMLSFIRQILPS